jgi:hypothetical protein
MGKTLLLTGFDEQGGDGLVTVRDSDAERRTPHALVRTGVVYGLRCRPLGNSYLLG